MKTYLRILKYARPLGNLLPQYIILTALSIVFGIVNLTLLIPLFDVLFDQVNPEKLEQLKTVPDFELSIDYFKQLFNYYFINKIENSGKYSALVFVSIIIIVSVFLTNLFRYGSELVIAVLRSRIIQRLRYDIFQKVTGLHLGYFSNERKGDLMSRITSDVVMVESTVVSTLKSFFKDPVTIITYFIVLFTLSSKLTLFSLLYFPIAGTIVAEITRRLKKKAVQGQQSIGNITNIADETLSGLRIIKAFNAAGFIREKFSRELEKYFNISMSMARKNAAASPLSEFLGISVVTGIILYGGSLVLNDEIKPSVFTTFIFIFSQILPPVKGISKAFSGVQRGLAAGERIFDVVDTQNQIVDAPQAKQIDEFKEGIAFSNVGFTYDDTPVLKDINLNIKKGQTIALVGPSGGGKSTLADLIPRFYDVKTGEICLDGVNIKDIETHSLRQFMGIVTQEAILFNDTIFNNIAFAEPNVTPEAVIKAAKIANAHEFIEKTENGYDTMIGERGTRLSGGQRQRISIARAVLKNPDILILDEATSALDSESEKLVQQALFNLMQNRTSLVIAHRLSTIQHADEIIVLQDGKIEERGTHQHLIDQRGLYYKLIQMQSL